ncbi:MFS transporter [Wukongibacter baidiensis]|uniref:MFS transporter n=1 Tax=Wukongibacter baidiensis TaxID=1723361 RepID=UPI003D7F78A1
MDKLQRLKKPIFLISLPNYFLGFIIPIYALQLGSNAVEIGMLFSVFSFFSIIMRPLVGRWTDKGGRKKGFIIGLVTFTLARLIFLVGRSYIYLFIARIIQCIAASFFSISLDAMISDMSSIDDRSKNFGIITQYSSRGAFIGSFIGFTILFNGIVDDPFKLIFGIYFIISVLAVYFAVKDVDESIGEKREVKSTKILINKTFIKYLMIIGVLALANGITAPIFVIYLKEHITKDLGLISLMFIPGGILAMYLPSKLGKLADDFGRKKLMVIGLAFEAIFTLLMPFARSYIFFVVLYALITFAGLMSIPAQRALVSEITGDDERGRSYGLYHLSLGLGGIFGPLIGGGIYQYINKDLVFFVEGVGLFLITIFIMFFIKSDNKIPNRDMLEI